MKIKSVLFLFVLLLSGFNLAAIELKLNQEYLVESEQYNEDYLFSGNALEFEGQTHDFYGFAEQIKFSGVAKMAVTAAGREIDITGTVGNGIKAAGRNIVINGKTTGTNFLGAEKVVFEQESEITGDTFVGARKVMIKGKLKGDFYAGAGEVSVQNVIHGNVQVHAGQLKISEQGKIIGNLIYHSDYALSEEEAARVTGDITFEKNENGGFHDTISDSYFDGSFRFSLLFRLSFAILGFLMLLFPIARSLEKQLSPKEILSHSLWGLIPIFVYPSAFVISILLLITIPLALALLLGFVPLLFVTKVIGITLIGGLIAGALNLSTKSRFMHFLIGIILYSLLSLIPFAGFLLMVFVSSIGCGLLLSSLFQKKLV